MAYRRPASARTEGRERRRLRQLLTQRIADGPRNSMARLDFIEGVAITLEQFHFSSVKTEDLVTIGRLKNPHQRLDMKAVRHNHHLGDRPLNPVDTEQSWRTEDRQAVERMVPKIAVIGENLKRLDERSDMPVRVLLLQRFLHRLD